jgi:hypothetical protein
MASTLSLASSLARELGISNHIPVAPTALTRVRGSRLSAVLVDEALWPLNPIVEDTLLPCLAKEKGYILRVLRVDPAERINLQERPWA